MIALMKRIARAISGIGEKPALFTEGGLLLRPKGVPSDDRRAAQDCYFRPTAIAYGLAAARSRG
jgi:hypothetical protein